MEKLAAVLDLIVAKSGMSSAVQVMCLNSMANSCCVAVGVSELFSLRPLVMTSIATKPNEFDKFVKLLCKFLFALNCSRAHFKNSNPELLHSTDAKVINAMHSFHTPNLIPATQTLLAFETTLILLDIIAATAMQKVFKPGPHFKGNVARFIFDLG
jgi:hypothetical protein